MRGAKAASQQGGKSVILLGNIERSTAPKPLVEDLPACARRSSQNHIRSQTETAKCCDLEPLGIPVAQSAWRTFDCRVCSGRMKHHLACDDCDLGIFKRLQDVPEPVSFGCRIIIQISNQRRHALSHATIPGAAQPSSRFHNIACAKLGSNGPDCSAAGRVVDNHHFIGRRNHLEDSAKAAP